MSEYFHHVLIGLLAVLPVANPLTSVSLLLGLGGSLPPAGATGRYSRPASTWR